MLTKHFKISCLALATLSIIQIPAANAKAIPGSPCLSSPFFASQAKTTCGREWGCRSDAIQIADAPGITACGGSLTATGFPANTFILSVTYSKQNGDSCSATCVTNKGTTPCEWTRCHWESTLKAE